MEVSREIGLSFAIIIFKYSTLSYIEDFRQEQSAFSSN